MDNIEEITNYHTLKRIAANLDLKVAAEDKGRDIKGKILDYMTTREIKELDPSVLGTSAEPVVADSPVVQEATEAPTSKIKTFTYVGAGTDSPAVIKFMNQIVFRRGEPTNIEDIEANQLIIFKLSGNQCFIEGGVEAETLFKIDEEAKVRSRRIEEEDKKIDLLLKKKNG